MPKKGFVGITIRREAWQRLKAVGRYGESFSDIIMRLTESRLN